MSEFDEPAAPSFAMSIVASARSALRDAWRLALTMASLVRVQSLRADDDAPSARSGRGTGGVGECPEVERVSDWQALDRSRSIQVGSLTPAKLALPGSVVLLAADAPRRPRRLQTAL